MLDRRGVLSLVVVACSAALAPVARADDPPQKPAGQTGAGEAPDESRHWYGAPMLVLDFLSTTAVVGGILSNDGRAAVPLATLGSAVYLAGGPVVHATEGRGFAALGSLGLRIGGPLALMGTGLLISVPMVNSCKGGGDEDGLCGLAYVVLGGIGLIAGAVTAAIVDDTALAWKYGSPEKKPQTAGLRIEALTPVMGMVLDERQHRVPTFGVGAVF